MPRYADIKPFVRDAIYKVTIPWSHLEHWLTTLEERILPDGHTIIRDGLVLCPDYQRGHVWTREQQIAFVEYGMRRGASGRDLYFNNPTWGSGWSTPTELVDGLQRLTAVRAFLAGEIPAFGYTSDQYEDKLPFSDWYFNAHIHNLPTRRQVLEWYIGLNAGGTPHNPAEIERVRTLLQAEPPDACDNEPCRKPARRKA